MSRFPSAVVESRGNAAFETTHWSAIDRARSSASGTAVAALDRLCTVYWTPIFDYARKKGLDHHAASDAAQEVFAKLLHNDFLRKISPERGRFRTYLLASLDHWILTQRARDRAAK